MGLTIETRWFRYRIGSNGENIDFLDKSSGINYCRPGTPCAWIRKNDKMIPVIKAEMVDGNIELEFGTDQGHATVKVTNTDEYAVLQVTAITGQDITEFKFMDLPLSLTGAGDEPFAICALALNLNTKVEELPGINNQPAASCYSRFGFGGRAALVGCPRVSLRDVIKQVMKASPDLPSSPVGGPWALDAPDNHGSYITGSVAPEQVDGWIEMLRAFGIDQFDFHGGKPFRFGDFRLDPKIYPQGRATLKGMIDRFHAAGVKVGIHSYSFFIDKSCPWVTPCPDPRLRKDAFFTLAAPLDETSSYVPVEEKEAAENMAKITGSGILRTSVILQIEDELIEYADVAKSVPFGFSKCRRGALGTVAAAHPHGVPVFHLREYYGLLVPDGDSSLLTEVAERHADFYNECGFDMIYLDALDGAHAIAGQEWRWHYSPKFVFELAKRLKNPAIMEMSYLDHHLWYVRSRHGAWDHPSRNAKPFINLHLQANEAVQKLMLPVNMGWWRIQKWMGVQGERSFEDEIELLCAKALAAGSSLSFCDISPEEFAKSDNLQRMAKVIRNYELIRRKGSCSAAVKAVLRRPEIEARLTNPEESQFQQVKYPGHKVEKCDGHGHTWSLENEFPPQPLKIRIETLFSVAPYDSPENVVLTEFDRLDEFYDRQTLEGVVHELKNASVEGKDWPCAQYSAWRESEQCGKDLAKINPMDPYGWNALSVNPKFPPGWTKITKRFLPALDCGSDENIGGELQGIGVWIHGDGRGELLNFQLRSMTSIEGAYGDHYVDVDFTGWRYFELVEHESVRINDYVWPYSRTIRDWWQIYGWVYHKHVETLSIWYNSLPPEGKVTCLLGPVKALPLTKSKLKNPRIKIGTQEILFPVELETGQYLEYFSSGDCKAYDANGDSIGTIIPVGKTPELVTGLNSLELTCDNNDGIRCRAMLTARLDGEDISAR